MCSDTIGNLLIALHGGSKSRWRSAVPELSGGCIKTDLLVTQERKDQASGVYENPRRMDNAYCS